MYLRKSEANELVTRNVNGLIESLKDRNAFMRKLSDGDDWSFVIKAQTLIEAAVTQAVISQIGDERIKKTIELMPLVGDEVSKLGLSKSFGLLTAEQRRFVKKMASLRNNLAHRPENVDFEFKNFISSLEKSAIRDWQESITWFADTPDSKKVWFRLAKESPKITLYLSVLVLVSLLEIDGAAKNTIREINATAEATTKEILKIQSHKNV